MDGLTFRRKRQPFSQLEPPSSKKARALEQSSSQVPGPPAQPAQPEGGELEMEAVVTGQHSPHITQAMPLLL